MTERYNSQIVILQTDEGICRDKKQLKRVWGYRIKENFPHYKLINAVLIKDTGKKRL